MDWIIGARFRDVTVRTIRMNVPVRLSHSPRGNVPEMEPEDDNTQHFFDPLRDSPDGPDPGTRDE